MRRKILTALLGLSLALSVVEVASAHRLDEYLQATLIGVTRDGIDVEINLTPGVAMLPVLMAVIDQDRDGRISSEEQQSYVGRVAREVELRVDGVPAPLSLIESNFPSPEAMRQGLGTIEIKLHAARSGHMLRFENRHLPQGSVYLVNCLADSGPVVSNRVSNAHAGSEGLVVSRQNRDEAQRSIEFEYSFASAPAGPRAAWMALGPFWPVSIGILLLARMAVLIYRSKRDKPHASGWGSFRL